MRAIPLFLLVAATCGGVVAALAAPPPRDGPAVLRRVPTKPVAPPPHSDPPPPPVGIMNLISPLQPPHGLGLSQPVTILTRLVCEGYKIDFGDGTSTTGALSGVNASVTLNHKYEKSGTMTLVATGTGTCTGTATQTVTIPPPGTVTSVTASPVPAIVHLDQHIRIETQGPCSLVAVDFGDGEIANVGSPGTAEGGDKYFVQFTHAYATPGPKMVKATGMHCSGTPQTTIDVMPPATVSGSNSVAGAQINPAVLPGFTLSSAGFYYLGRGEVNETAEGGTVALPVPSANGPGPVGNDVFFRFAANAIPTDVMQALANYSISSHPGLTVTLGVSGADSRSPSDAVPGVTLQTQGEMIYLTAQFDLRTALAHAPLQVTFEVTHNGTTYKAKPATLKAGSPMGSFFKMALYPTFQSDRCQTCHSMGDQATLDNQHSKIYGVAPDGGFANLPGSQVQPDKTVGCDECHNQSIGVTEWKTPAFDKGINWKTMTSWQEVCFVVLGHLPTAQQRHDHFHNDPRVHWAITSGKIPPGDQPPLPKAPPASWTEWLSYVDAWDGLSQPCAD